MRLDRAEASSALSPGEGFFFFFPGGGLFWLSSGFRMYVGVQNFRHPKP